MLLELQAHHARILQSIDELRRLLDSETVQELALATARLQLSKASATRARFLADTVYPALHRIADPKLAEDLKRLSDDFLSKRQVSSEHVTTWTSRAVRADWSGYKAASRQIQQMMLDRIELEKRLLYPRL